MPVYVYSGAGGSNNGTSWTDAYTSIASTTGVAAGTEIWVASDHSEALGVNTSWNWSNGTFANPVRILSVARADDTLVAGAAIGASNGFDLSILGGLYLYGVTVNCGDDLTLSSGGLRQTYDHCEIAFVGSAQSWTFTASADSGGMLRFVSSTFNYSVSSTTIAIVHGGRGTLEIKNCTILPPSTATTFVQCTANYAQRVLIENTDVSAWTNVFNATTAGFVGIVRRCKINGTFSANAGTTGENSSILVEQCEDGTISTPPLGLTEFHTLHGTVKGTLSRYRTGGADDGEQANAYAWEMASSSATEEIYRPLASPPMTRWVDAGSHTITVYVASGVTLQDDEFWVEVSSPDEGGSPTAQGTFTVTRLAPRGTPADLTTDGSSTWNGSGVGTKQKIEVAITPAVAGPLTVRCFLAKPSTTVYVDPKIEVA